MATKSRHLKTAMQLWVADQRKAGGYTSADLAEWTGVIEDTARGWESRGRPSEDAIRILERKFGKAAPDGEEPSADQSSLVSAIRDLVEELRLTRLEQARWNKGVEETLAAVLEGRIPGVPTGDPASQPREGVPR